MAHETYTLAVVSTAHLSAAEAKGLENGLRPQFLVALFDEGWFVSCHSAKQPDYEADQHWPALEAVRAWAAAQGHEYVMLDRDAETATGLPVYCWETPE